MERSIDELVENIAWASTDYSPKDPDTLTRLNQTTMACVIGPVAVGKNTVISEAMRSDEEFGKVISFTTRQRRDNEDATTYRFRPHDQETLQSIDGQLKQGSLTQCVVHEKTGRVYWSDKDSYYRPLMLLDTLASSVTNINKLPFKRVEEITLTALPDEWMHRFQRRAKEIGSDDEILARLSEAVSSLEWSLEKGKDMKWVVNREGFAHQAGLNVIGLIRGTVEPFPQNRQVGEELLGRVREIT